MNNNKNAAKLAFGAILVVAVSLIGQSGLSSYGSADALKIKWNERFPEHKAVHVERMTNMDLFQVYTEDTIYFAPESLREVISGTRLVPSGQHLTSLPVFSERSGSKDRLQNKSDKRLNVTTEGQEQVLQHNDPVSSQEISTSENNASIDETKELVTKLKSEIAKTLSDRVNAKKESPGDPELSDTQESETDNARLNQSEVDKVDTDNIREDDQFVFYARSKIPKVQFDSLGQKLDEESRRDKIKKIFDNTIQRSDKWTIPYLADNEKLKIIVFSDPTCPYCQKMHRDIDRLNDAGISVYYLLYPRALSKGSDDESAKSVVSMMNTYWCSETPQSAMDQVYNHEAVDNQGQCYADKQGRTELPVQEHYLLGRIFNLIATPLTVIEDGRLLYGYGGYKDFMSRVGEF